MENCSMSPIVDAGEYFPSFRSTGRWGSVWWLDSTPITVAERCTQQALFYVLRYGVWRIKEREVRRKLSKYRERAKRVR
jgi:hypothetical protein